MGSNGTKLMGPKRVKKWSKWDKKESKADQMELIRNKMAERVLSTRVDCTKPKTNSINGS